MAEKRRVLRADKLFDMSVQQYTADLREFLVLAGTPQAEAWQWSSHCARRGSAADVLAAEGPLPLALGGAGWRANPRAFGVPGMLAHGEWATKAAAAHYASLDEMDQCSLAISIAEDSGSD